jgi:hypothetical protein
MKYNNTIDDDPSHFGQMIDNIKRAPKATLVLFFIIILNMNFDTSRANAHNTSITTLSTTHILQSTKQSFNNI